MYSHLMQKFSQFNILVIGDLILDVYVKGVSTRLTPEAPVPVVDVQSDETVLGGAANTAINMKSLGAAVTFCGVTGEDVRGYQAVELLESAGVKVNVLRRGNRKTLVKTRVVADTQLLIRYDSGTVNVLDSETESTFIDLLRVSYKAYDAVVIADYNKGLLTPGVLEALKDLMNSHRPFLAVDSGRLQYFKLLSPTLVKPNYSELHRLLSLDDGVQDRVEQISDLGKEIQLRTGADITAVTLDKDGAVIFDKGDRICRCRAHPVLSPQVSGAGDAYIGTFTLALLAGTDVTMAAELSAAAAAIAISKKTTATCSAHELKAYLSMNEKYVENLEELLHIINVYKANGRKIVFTNGCFDILHSGHVSYLNRARDLGHVLIVGINTDESIKRLKGNSRPINSLQDRVQVLSGLGAVDHIIAFGSQEDDTPIPLISVIQPHIFTKGGDYTKDTLPEAALIEQLGGEIILLPLLPDRSTTIILDRINKDYTLKLA